MAEAAKNESKADYEMGKLLGEGASCSVSIAKRKKDNMEVAFKSLQKTKKVHKTMFDKEISILKDLKHPNVLKLVTSFETPRAYCIVTELSKGGELFDAIVDEKNPMTEKDVANIVRQMLEALDYLHRQNIVHRDLKPENFIFKTKAKKTLILIDFGTALRVEDEKEYKDLVGTPFYLAPESASSDMKSRKGKCLKSSDIWAVGVIAYICMTGSPPFFGNSNREICQAITHNALSFPKNISLSKEFKDFVKKCMTKRWKKRITMDDAIQHQWILKSGDKKVNIDAIRSLRQFNYQSKLKKLVAGILQVNMGDGPAERVEKHFKELDTDGSGTLTRDELAKLFTNAGYQEGTAKEQVDMILGETDTDGDGTISLQEFGVVWQRKLLAVNDKYIKAVFKVLDGDGDGSITAEELKAVLGSAGDSTGVGVALEEVEAIIKEADANGDGKIQFKEFKNAMKERIPPPQSTKISKHDLAAAIKEE